MKFKPLLILGIILLIGTALLIGCSNSDDTEETIDTPIASPTPSPTLEPTPTFAPTPTPTETVAPSGNPIATVRTNMGDITIELYRDKVPVTVDNFVKLANDGFYEGVIFHRIKDNFMIQGGAQTVDGQIKQSPYGSIDLEIHPEARHIDGAISMARTSNPNSATSQFFICDGKQAFLDDAYAVFGIVIEGIDVVHDIAAQPHDNSLGGGTGVPLTPVIIESVEVL